MRSFLACVICVGSTAWPVHVTFRNDAARHVRVRRVDDEGALAPGHERRFACDVGDVFVVYRPTSSGQKVLLVHKVKPVPIVASSDANSTLVRCVRPLFTADQRWTPPDSFLLRNTIPRSVDLYYVDGDCEEYVGSVGPHQEHHMQSTVGHSFAFRVPPDNTRVGGYTLSRISIRDDDACEEHGTTECTREFRARRMSEKVVVASPLHCATGASDVHNGSIPTTVAFM